MGSRRRANAPLAGRRAAAKAPHSRAPRTRGSIEPLKRLLSGVAALLLAVTVVFPAAAFAQPDRFEPSQTASVAVTPQALTVQAETADPGVNRDTYTIELPKPVQSVGYTATAIPGLLSTWPCSGFVNDGYGPREGGFHYGIDLICPGGATEVAAGPGVVIEVAYDGSYGQYVKIDHGQGVATLCAHMVAGSPPVQVGQGVSAGQPIGLVGDTGNATVEHCHFEVWVNGNRVDPIPWLP